MKLNIGIIYLIITTDETTRFKVVGCADALSPTTYNRFCNLQDNSAMSPRTLLRFIETEAHEAGL